MSVIKITKIRSEIGRPQTQRATLRGLGLRKIHQTVVLEDTPSVRGMVNKVHHLIRVDS